MKKHILLATLALFCLSGCTTIQRAIRGDEYVDASISAEANAKAAAKFSEEQKEALTNKHAVFPQLDSKVGDKEAEVKLITDKGDITIKLFPEYAPLAVENFLTHAKNHYYDNVLFHRVITDFMIQGGDPKGDGTGGTSIWDGKDTSIDNGQGFVNEISPYLYNIRGALAMANAGPHTNGSQFFINQNPNDGSKNLTSTTYPQKIIEAYKNGGNPSLDRNYTVFGQVIAGMDVVDQIASVETNAQNKPQEEVHIQTIEILKDYDFDQ